MIDVELDVMIESGFGASKAGVGGNSLLKDIELVKSGKGFRSRWIGALS